MRKMFSTLIVLLALTFTNTTWGQQSDGSQNQDQNAQQQQQRERQRRRQQEARQRSQDQGQRERTQRGGQQDSISQSEREEARIHYQAGLVAGYMLGYADGLDDYVIIVGTPSRGREATTSAERENQRMRDQMRQRARSRAMEQQRGRQLQAGRIASGQQQRVTGEIRSIKRVTLRNDNQRHLLLLVETHDNRRRIIDAGPAQQTQNLDLQQGDTVTAVGRFLRTRDGVPVLNAQRIEAQGQSVAIRGNSQTQQRIRR
jgi:hypothetical protein